MAEAVRIRTSWGLRSDPEWIAAVAKRTDTDTAYGTPLTPDEIAELNRRSAAADAIRPEIQAYVARHADESGGIYLDQAQGGVFVTLWTGHVAEHEAAIRALVGPDANIAVRAVRHTESELLALQTAVTDALAWMKSIGAQLMSSAVDIVGNRVTLQISSANANAPALILDHVGTTADLLAITSDGTGLELLPRGTIRGRVVDRSGRPVAGLDVNPTSKVSSWCGDEVGHGTDDDGRFELDHCAPTTWTIQVFRDYRHILATADVRVQPGKVAEVLIRLP
jgi:hypothetical protein